MINQMITVVYFLSVAVSGLMTTSQTRLSTNSGCSIGLCENYNGDVGKLSPYKKDLLEPGNLAGNPEFSNVWKKLHMTAEKLTGRTLAIFYKLGSYEIRITQ